MQIKLLYLNQFKLILISLLSFVFANFYFYLFNSFFHLKFPEIIVFIILFFQNFFLLYFFKLYSYSLNSFLKIALISFFGRCSDISIFYLLMFTTSFESELSFFFALIISNIFKIFYLLKYKNYQ